MKEKTSETGPSAGIGRFSLIGMFSIQGLIYIGLVSVVTSWLLANFLESHLLQRDATVIRQFVERIAHHHDPRSYFSNTGKPADAALNEFFADIAHMPDVARINAYGLDHVLFWSSDSRLTGKVFKGNQELDKALAGELVIKKGVVSQTEKSEHLAFSQNVDWFVENYIPIRDQESRKILGVVEIYRIPYALNESIHHGRLLVWASVVTGGVFLYLSLFWIIRRAQRLIDSQQLALIKQERLSTVGEMAWSVAHSIRNPIASMRSSAELALDGTDNPDINNSLREIIGEADRFDGWIRELLTFAGEPGDAEATAKVAPVVERAHQDNSQRAARQGVEIEIRSRGNLPDVRGEERLLVQALNSLVANALDAMPQGGKLVIDAAAAGSAVRIVIADSGFGIPADKIDNLLDPLVGHTQGGQGIGLALVRQIVHRYAGSINLRSEPGQGTTVTIELPLAPA